MAAVLDFHFQFWQEPLLKWTPPFPFPPCCLGLVRGHFAALTKSDCVFQK